MRSVIKIINILVTLGIVVFVIALGGYYAGKMIGLVILAIILVAYLVISDAIKIYHKSNISWLKATYQSCKEIINFWLK
jgi:hypothetical protein